MVTWFVCFLLICLLAVIYTIGLRRDKRLPIQERMFYTDKTNYSNIALPKTEQNEVLYDPLKSMSEFGIIGIFAPPGYFML